jgi:hypothetical protein
MAEPWPEWDGVASLGKIYWHLHWVADRLPGQSDGHFQRRVLGMESAPCSHGPQGSIAKVRRKHPGPMSSQSPNWATLCYVAKSISALSIQRPAGSAAWKLRPARWIGTGTISDATLCAGDRPTPLLRAPALWRGLVRR